MTISLDNYRKFIRRASEELLAVPDNPMSLLSGSDFRTLRPELYERVLQGHVEFGVPKEKLCDDLVAACALRRRALRWRLHFARGFRHVVLFLGVLWLVRIVFPLTSRKMRGPPVEVRWDHVPAQGKIAAAAPAKPLTSIVVLSYNRLAYLQTTLAALRETVGDAPYELIVVDNGSRDGSVPFLRDCHARGLVSEAGPAS